MLKGVGNEIGLEIEIGIMRVLEIGLKIGIGIEVESV